MGEWYELCMCLCFFVIHPCAVLSSSIPVNTVDIFDATSGTWSTAALSVARFHLHATSLPEYGLAMFAGGQGALHVLMSVIAGRREHV